MAFFLVVGVRVLLWGWVSGEGGFWSWFWVRSRFWSFVLVLVGFIIVSALVLILIPNLRFGCWSRCRVDPDVWFRCVRFGTGPDAVSVLACFGFGRGWVLSGCGPSLGSSPSVCMLVSVLGWS